MRREGSRTGGDRSAGETAVGSTLLLMGRARQGRGGEGGGSWSLLCTQQVRPTEACSHEARVLASRLSREMAEMP